MSTQSGMNLPSRSSTVVSDIKNQISSMRQETSLLKQDWSSLVQTMQTGSSRLQLSPSGQTSNTPGVYNPYGSHKVAPDPVFHNAGGNGGTNQIFSGPQASITAGSSFTGGSGGGGVSGTGGGASSGGGGGMFRNLSDFVSQNPGAASLYGAGLAIMGANSTSDMVEAQLLRTRSAAFMNSNMGNTNVLYGNGFPGQANVVNALGGGTNAQKYVQNAMLGFGELGTMKDKMDAFRAVAVGQTYGLNGPNYLKGASGGFGATNPSVSNAGESFAAGVAQSSNLVPGLTGEGAMRVAGSIQSGKNVNMLRAVGIQVRDQNGNLKPTDQVIEDLWAKLCRDFAGAYGAGKKPTIDQMQISFQQGNSMDMMLQNLFGTDPLVYETIKNGLLFKAKTQGMSAQDQVINKANLTREGFTTAAVNANSKNAVQGSQGLALTANAGSNAFAAAKEFLTLLGAGANTTAPGGVLALNSLAAGVQTLGAGGNGVGNKLIQFLMALMGKNGLATGGPADAQNVYMVGEKGPELFVPKTNGTVIPNDVTSSLLKYKGGRASGGEVFAKDVLAGLGDKATTENMANLLDWISHEGKGTGKPNEGGKYNFLNTKWGLPGATNYNSEGVKNYKTEKQGVEATIKTLKGNAGYKGILDALAGGKTSVSDFESIVGASPWGTFKSGSSAVTKLDADQKKLLVQMLGAQGEAQFEKYLSSGGKDLGSMSLSSILGMKGSAGLDSLNQAMGSMVNNYGGVTFNMNVIGGDPKQLQKAIKDAMSQLQTGNVSATK